MVSRCWRKPSRQLSPRRSQKLWHHASMARRDTALFVLLCALWGFSFVALKTALKYADPIFLASIRFWAPGSIVAAGLALTGRRVMPRREEWPGLLLLGLTNTALLAMFLNLGQERI